MTDPLASTPLDIARQRLACLGRCEPDSGFSCLDYNDRPDLYTYCDDGQGSCPSPDCVYKGPCLCLCHSPMGTNT